ncbi:MAG: bifunctional diaminohydroxyphosphoribosylaminopyrimidine deaminase/5-amino-6-(5-phosphoribosylamino)uracil reductase RibD [Desulfobulbaceae bacterium]|nr:bifunctional diaminohydroxyphosphoribosylaminopyrimidine deaminase/5-amino-6-(5-phosphoribosylamino)uracil reductase RibD [Desulfobulbaceae bacterium]
MRLALDEAKKGVGRTSPNPAVGAVIVQGDEVVGKGYHHKAGEPHAEVNAIADAGKLSKGSTIYVTLEPCNHTGRTPPCTRAVLDAGIERVVIGMCDPNPIACGGGDFLRSQGVFVSKGILEKECRQLNYPFIKHSTTGLPWILMKAGTSLDGKITWQQGVGGPITGAQSRQAVHLLRNQLDGILIGVGTALIDKPSLTTRLSGREGRDPVRIILDTHLRLSPDARMLQQKSSADTLIFCSHDAACDNAASLEQAGAVICRVGLDKSSRLDLSEVLKKLGTMNIISVLVEGGAAVHGSFLNRNLVDQVCLFIAPVFIGGDGTPLVRGYSAPDNDNAVTLHDVTVEQLGDDVVLKGLVHRAL